LAEVARNRRSHDHQQQPSQVISAAAMGEQIESEWSGSKKKHPDPDRQVRDAIAPRVALAHIAVFRIFHLDWVSHLTAIVPHRACFSIIAKAA
jgi:hypothetical protein